MRIKWIIFGVLLALDFAQPLKADDFADQLENFFQSTEQDARQDYAWYIREAQKGNSFAQVYLGTMYEKGQGVSQDDKQAVVWYRKSAEQGNQFAQYILAIMYIKGKGVAQDYKQAAIWFRKAAEQGYVEAQFNLGVMYSKGKGVTQDFKQAYVWFSVAAANGDLKAPEARDLIVNLLTPKDLNEAQSLAGRYFDQYQPKR